LKGFKKILGDSKMSVLETSNRQNPFLCDFVTLMHNGQFQEFRHKYMKDWSDVETVFMYIYVYEFLSHEFRKQFHRSITDKELIKALQSIFSESDLRKTVVHMFRQFQQNEAGDCPQLPNSHKKIFPRIKIE
jgi:hypothetical protein